jgi:hypothetical protein
MAGHKGCGKEKIISLTQANDRVNIVGFYRRQFIVFPG